MNTVFCYAHGNDEGWEAICLNFDLAVQGESFEAVRASLEQAIRMYIDYAVDQPEAVREELLSRRAPWHVRAKVAFQLFTYSLFRSRPKADAQAGFPVPCPA